MCVGVVFYRPKQHGFEPLPTSTSPWQEISHNRQEWRPLEDLNRSTHSVHVAGAIECFRSSDGQGPTESIAIAFGGGSGRRIEDLRGRFRAKLHVCKIF
jgi:hypothetical protein